MKVYILQCIHNNERYLYKGSLPDGLSCPNCNRSLKIVTVFDEIIPIEFATLPDYQEAVKEKKQSKSQHNEIEIIMSSTNEPPKVKLNGEVIDSIIELGYEFVTKDHESNGYHNFTVKYVDKKTNTVRTVSANKMVEGR